MITPDITDLFARKTIFHESGSGLVKQYRIRGYKHYAHFSADKAISDQRCNSRFAETNRGIKHERIVLLPCAAQHVECDDLFLARLDVKHWLIPPRML